jgi:cyclopropane fatty-acyl-phospholipid synthase-like methyltransferase
MQKFVAKNVQEKNIKTVMDVGAGDFVALEKIVETLPGASFSAIDPSFEEDTYKGIQVYKTMLRDFVAKDVYDLVMAVHVLEHVGNLREFISQLEGIAGKYLYIEIPFQVSPGLFLNRSANAQHINYFTVGTMKRLIESYGFEVQDCEFSADGYTHNGMPGMIRIFAIRGGKGTSKSSLLETLYHLFNPWLFVKARFF